MVEKLLSEISAGARALRAAHKLTRRRLAPEFNPFEFIDTRETQLSRILGWALNPKGSHGQGDTFLRRFLEKLGGDWVAAPADGALMRLEVSTRHLEANRRIDILLLGKGWALAIENKPYAGDQPKQIVDYLRQLDKVKRDLKGLVYLSGPGAEPSDLSIDSAERQARAGQLHFWAYADLLPWLDACRLTCEADRVSIFLDEIQRWVRQSFLGVTDMMERDQIVRTATASHDAVEAAMLVAAAARDIRIHLLSTLKASVEKRIDPRWKVESKLDQNKWPRLTIDYDAGLPATFTMEFGSPKGAFNPLSWGLRYRKEGFRGGAKLAGAMVERFGRAPSSSWWAWQKTVAPADDIVPLESNWEAAAQPWVDLARDEVAPLVAEAARQVRDALVVGGHLTKPKGRPPSRRS